MTSNSMNTSNLTSINGHRMTKEEVQQKSDAELLQMINQAKGHTGIDFSDYMHCDFSYSYLTGLLRDRGYENGWHKVINAPATAQKPTVIQIDVFRDVSFVTSSVPLSYFLFCILFHPIYS